MDIFTLLTILIAVGIGSLSLAVISLILVIVIRIKTPPAQLKEQIRQAQIQADPRRRKAALIQDREEERTLHALFDTPPTYHLTGWMGSILGKDITNEENYLFGS